MTEFWQSKNVFVTGADGFIGSWLAKTLIDKGANVFVIIRDIKRVCSLDLLKIKDKVNIIQGDIIDLPCVERIINEKEIDSVFHLAAQALVGVANKSPISTFESNIKGTWNVLEACRLNNNVKRVVVASSDKAYGVQKELPYKEDSPLLGNYPYDASKACADILTKSYAITYNLPVAITRNANTYGGADLNFSRIIPDAICSILKNSQFVIRSDGTLERDYMYVKDAVSGYLILAENIDKKGLKGQAFNFGTGKPISVLDLFKTISSVMGKKDIKPKILGTAKNEIDRQFLSIEKVKKTFDWQPKYSLEEGLKETVEWYNNNLDLIK
ncbi:MAG: GDP-mannose 4,6-dehydratase [Nanoarchaeota archaeon]|nr:GDP-mannose 4,6-dehydratase [Nanoarchaeota archaeon]MBU1004767.1 GDP-mannose 4,6-dehydratase [Nanoarchaeota archaeon]MBU1946006.1 GDP-mannose 4,6-dehydratase [Nanoarchaeota archaeon]